MLRAHLLKSVAKNRKLRKDFSSAVKNRLLEVRRNIPADYLAALENPGVADVPLGSDLTGPS